MPEIILDGRVLHAPEGATILEAAELADIEIPTLCYLPGKPPQTSCFLCVVRVEGVGRLLPACATRVADGMVVHNQCEEVVRARRTAIELLLSDHLGDCVGPCQSVCPAHMDIPRMMALTAEGRFREALIVVKQAIPLPATLGRICPELCEKGCRRGAYDGPLAVCKTKRFLADNDLASEEPYVPECLPATGRKVAIVGSGPAGLSAAYYLRLAGHEAVVFDEKEAPGGALRYGVSRDVLPESVLDAEVDIIRRMGAQFVQRTRLGRDLSLEELRQQHDAVVIAAGDIRSQAEPWDALGLGPQGLAVERGSYSTRITGVFAAGGCIAPLRHAIRSIADGRGAASAADAFLTGSSRIGTWDEFSVHVGKLDAVEVRPFLRLGAAEGRHTPTMPDGGFTPDEAMREAARCLHCACAKAASCKLREYATRYDCRPLQYAGARREFSLDDSHPDILFEPGKCIACGICVRIAAEARERLGIGFAGRGFSVRTAVPFDCSLVEGLRDVALQCADACPTGALIRRPDI